MWLLENLKLHVWLALHFYWTALPWTLFHIFFLPGILWKLFQINTHGAVSFFSMVAQYTSIQLCEDAIMRFRQGKFIVITKSPRVHCWELGVFHHTVERHKGNSKWEFVGCRWWEDVGSDVWQVSCPHSGPEAVKGMHCMLKERTKTQVLEWVHNWEGKKEEEERGNK